MDTKISFGNHLNLREQPYYIRQKRSTAFSKVTPAQGLSLVKVEYWQDHLDF